MTRDLFLIWSDSTPIAHACGRCGGAVAGGRVTGALPDEAGQGPRGAESALARDVAQGQLGLFQQFQCAIKSMSLHKAAGRLADRFKKHT